MQKESKRKSEQKRSVRFLSNPKKIALPSILCATEPCTDGQMGEMGGMGMGEMGMGSDIAIFHRPPATLTPLSPVVTPSGTGSIVPSRALFAAGGLDAACSEVCSLRSLCSLTVTPAVCAVCPTVCCSLRSLQSVFREAGKAIKAAGVVDQCFGLSRCVVEGWSATDRCGMIKAGAEMSDIAAG